MYVCVCVCVCGGGGYLTLPHSLETFITGGNQNSSQSENRGIGGGGGGGGGGEAGRKKPNLSQYEYYHIRLDSYFKVEFVNTAMHTYLTGRAEVLVGGGGGSDTDLVWAPLTPHCRICYTG